MLDQPVILRLCPSTHQPSRNAASWATPLRAAFIARWCRKAPADFIAVLFKHIDRTPEVIWPAYFHVVLVEERNNGERAFYASAFLGLKHYCG